MVADIALPISNFRLFSYEIQPGLMNKLKVGMRVYVKFGKLKTIGVVINIKENSEYDGKLNTILEIVDNFSFFTQEQLDIAGYWAIKTLTPLGMVLYTMMSGIKGPPKRKLCLKNEAIFDLKLNFFKKDEGLFNAICEHKRVLYIDEIRESGLYIYLIDWYLKRKKRVFLMVPNNRLYDFWLKKLSIFGEKFLEFSNRITLKKKYVVWQKVLDGDVFLCIGMRQLAFLPAKSDDLFIVFDEDADSYNETRGFYYNAVDFLLDRKHIRLLLSTPTPRLSIYHGVKIHLHRKIKYKNNSIYTRFIREQYIKSDTVFRSYILSIKALADNERAIMIYPGDSFSGLIFCGKCDNIFRCKHCLTPLIYKNGSFRCKNCKIIYPELTCPSCGETSYRFLKYGREKLENIMSEILGDNIKKIILYPLTPYINIQENVKIIGLFYPDIFFTANHIDANFRLFSFIKRAYIMATNKNNAILYIFFRVLDEDMINDSNFLNMFIDTHAFLERELSILKGINLPPFGDIFRLLIKDKKDLLKEEIKGLCINMGIECIDDNEYIKFNTKYRGYDCILIRIKGDSMEFLNILFNMLVNKNANIRLLRE